MHFHSLYIMSYEYAKLKENPCVGTDASTPLDPNTCCRDSGGSSYYETALLSIRKISGQILRNSVFLRSMSQDIMEIIQI